MTGLVLVLALAACAPAPAPAPQPAQPAQPSKPTPTDAAPPLEGTLWVLNSYVDHTGATVAPIPGTRVTAELKDGFIGGNASCNQYNGAYTLDGDSLQFILGPMTMMACEEAVMQQEMNFLADLGDVTTYEISGNQLSMMDESGAVALTFTVDEPLAFVGTNWQVQSYNNGKGGLVSSLNTELMTALYAADGTVSGFGGCNNYNGPYTTDGDGIQVGPLVTTRKACLEPETLMDDEAGYLAALQRVASYNIRGAELTMYDAEGARTVVYNASPAAETPVEVAGSAAPMGDPVMVDDVTMVQRGGDWVAVVTGNSPDACPRKFQSEQQASGDAIEIALTSVAPQDAMCAQMLTPFTEEVVIDTTDMQPGEYSVSVNGVAADEPITVGVAAKSSGCAGLDLAGISLDTQGLPYPWQANCIPAAPYDASMPPGPQGLPEHVVINFGVVDPADRQPGDPILYIIPVEAYKAIWDENDNPGVSETIDQIEFQTALLPMPAETSGYPALPYEEITGVNDLAVQVGRVTPAADSASKNGFRFVGRWAQDANPVTNQGLRYTYQGFTNDGRYLVSFWYPVSTAELPNDVADVPADAIDLFNSDPAAAISADAERLNSLTPSDWEPDLSQLDALVSSLVIEGMSANTLGNGVWEWTALRNPNTGEETPLTDGGVYQITFNPDGTFELKADCNNASGSYTADGGLMGSMRFSPGPMTLAECGSDSQSSNLISWLPGIQNYRGHAGGTTLDLSLPAGGGELVFKLAGMDESTP